MHAAYTFSLCHNNGFVEILLCVLVSHAELRSEFDHLEKSADTTTVRCTGCVVRFCCTSCCVYAVVCCVLFMALPLVRQIYLPQMGPSAISGSQIYNVAHIPGGCDCTPSTARNLDLCLHASLYFTSYARGMSCMHSSVIYCFLPFCTACRPLLLLCIFMLWFLILFGFPAASNTGHHSLNLRRQLHAIPLPYYSTRK